MNASVFDIKNIVEKYNYSVVVCAERIYLLVRAIREATSVGINRSTISLIEQALPGFIINEAPIESYTDGLSSINVKHFIRRADHFIVALSNRIIELSQPTAIITNTPSYTESGITAIISQSISLEDIGEVDKEWRNNNLPAETTTTESPAQAKVTEAETTHTILNKSIALRPPVSVEVILNTCVKKLIESSLTNLSDALSQYNKNVAHFLTFVKDAHEQRLKHRVISPKQREILTTSKPIPLDIQMNMNRTIDGYEKLGNQSLPHVDHILSGHDHYKYCNVIHAIVCYGHIYKQYVDYVNNIIELYNNSDIENNDDFATRLNNIEQSNKIAQITSAEEHLKQMLNTSLDANISADKVYSDPISHESSMPYTDSITNYLYEHSPHINTGWHEGSKIASTLNSFSDSINETSILANATHQHIYTLDAYEPIYNAYKIMYELANLFTLLKDVYATHDLLHGESAKINDMFLQVI